VLVHSSTKLGRRIVSDVLIQVDRLSKVFRLGLSMRRVEAVKGVSFEVRRGISGPERGREDDHNKNAHWIDFSFIR